MKKILSLILMIHLSVCVHHAYAQAISADSLFNSGDWKQAIEEYKHYLDVVPTDKPGYQWNKIGQCYFNLKDWENSITAFKKALAYSGNPNVMYNIACAYAKSSQKDSTLKWLDRTADAGFTQYINMAADEDLQSVKDESHFLEIVLKVKKNAVPCSFQPESSQFDFWIGRWKVYNLQGQQAGTSEVDQILGDCVIFENWSDSYGNNGKSFNFFNSSDKKWQQTWVDDKGSVIEFINGIYKDGAMRFPTSRPSVNPANGTKVYRRLTFFNSNPNEVRQLGERSDDNQKSWQTEYDLKYIREQ
jgi:tetratricopeptide (TPR) repeat protein